MIRTIPLLLLTLISLTLSSCRVNRYYYVAEEPIELYEFQSFSGDPVATAQIGDTLATTGAETIGLGGKIPVEYRGYRFYSPFAKARFLRVSKVRPKRDAAVTGLVYAAKLQQQKREAQVNLSEVVYDTTDWYGQIEYLAPVLTNPLAGSKEFHKLPPKAIVKVKRHNFNYWQVSVNGRTGYINAFQVYYFSKTERPFVKIPYTGRTFGPDEDEGSRLTNTPSTGAYIHTGPRGGQYYYNSRGNKTYVKRSTTTNSSSYRPSSSSYRSRSSSSSYRSSGRRR